ncbi:MAG: putative nucleic-acid-binding protein, partial [Limisphaerales bacterium]
GRYSQDDHLYTQILRSSFSEDDLVFRFTTEVIFSIGEKKSKGFLSSRELRQIFFVDKSNAETMERNVSEVHKYMLATHNVVQYLHDNHKEKLDGLAMPPITYVPKSKGIHGT